MYPCTMIRHGNTRPRTSEPRCISRRRLLGAITLSLVRVPLPVEGQPSMHRIGVLAIGARTSGFDGQSRPMIEQLRTDGWVEGANIAFEYRFDEGKRERLPALAADLVKLKVSAIVAVGTPAALAAKGATASIPIVMVHVGDPVRSGLVASLRSPGGNVTGMAFLGSEITAKQVQLLKEVVPHARSLGLLFDPLNPNQVDALTGPTFAAAAAAGLKLHPIKADASAGLDAAFAEVIRTRVDVLLVWPLSRAAGWIQEAAALATKHRLVTLGTFRTYAEQGMLLSYIGRAEEQFQRAAVYIDRLLKGAKPADLPVEQPTRFDLTINLKTAKILGLTIPPSLLLRADHVIE